MTVASLSSQTTLEPDEAQRRVMILKTAEFVYRLAGRYNVTLPATLAIEPDGHASDESIDDPIARYKRGTKSKTHTINKDDVDDGQDASDREDEEDDEEKEDDRITKTADDQESVEQTQVPKLISLRKRRIGDEEGESTNTVSIPRLSLVTLAMSAER